MRPHDDFIPYWVITGFKIKLVRKESIHGDVLHDLIKQWVDVIIDYIVHPQLVSETEPFINADQSIPPIDWQDVPQPPHPLAYGGVYEVSEYVKESTRKKTEERRQILKDMDEELKEKIYFVI